MDVTLAVLATIVFFAVLALGVWSGMTWVFGTDRDGVAALRLVTLFAALAGWVVFGIWSANVSGLFPEKTCPAGNHVAEVYAGTYMVGQTVMVNYDEQCVPDRPASDHAA